MRSTWINTGLFFVILWTGLSPLARGADPTPTGFTYQGRLFEGATAASGLYDLRFTLYDAATGGTLVGAPVSLDAVPVSSGLFSVNLDFGAAFEGSARWLQVEERQSGAGAYTLLNPRQPVTSVPYANHAITAGAVPAAGLTGTIADERLSGNVALLNSSPNFAGTVTAAGFAGNGAGLTGVPVQDGSITAAKLAPDVQYVRPEYVRGVMSGLPGDFSLRVLIDRQATSPPATLAAPYSEVCQIVQQVAPDGTMRINAGLITNGPLVLRRIAGANNDWLRFREHAVSNLAIMNHEIELVLLAGKEEMARWRFTQCFVLEHNLRLADDGRPVEQTSWSVTGPVGRRVASPPPIFGIPRKTGNSAGFTSGLVTAYSASIAGVELKESCIIGSDIRNSSELVIESMGVEGFGSARPGKPVVSPFSLLQSPLARQDLFPWYETVRSGAPDRKPVRGKVGSTPLIDLLQCWPHFYSLALADDGLPYEEFRVVFESTAVPQ